jgi:hypothetical protein
MKVNELLDEGWASKTAMIAAPFAIAVGTAYVAPKATIDGNTYDKTTIHMMDKAKDLKHGVTTLHGKKVKVVYGTVTSQAKGGPRDIKVYAVKDDQ